MMDMSFMSFIAVNVTLTVKIDRVVSNNVQSTLAQIRIRNGIFWVISCVVDLAIYKS